MWEKLLILVNNFFLDFWGIKVSLDANREQGTTYLLEESLFSLLEAVCG